VGLKPSYNLISTRGVVPLSIGLDHVGLLARTVADAAMLLHALADPDADIADDCSWTPSGRLDELTLGVLENFADEQQETAVSESFDQARNLLARLGAPIRSIRLPTYDPVRGRRAAFLQSEVEAAYFYGAVYGTESERFSPEMRRYLDYGSRALATELVAAQRRTHIAGSELVHCFKEVDAIISPTTPQSAPAFGSRMPDNVGTYSVLANFAGTPAISVPMGRDEAGLPLGLQIIGPVNHEARVLQIAAAYEAAASIQLLPPPPIGPRRTTSEN
jgi:aspartyl-tRNA(Asn)/glutamyl-tRNA(Gln) amidotransferase subunit A